MEEEQQKNNVHQNHRKRMREKFRKEGLSAFHDHEVLEMLLYYVFRQKDTNALAHTLLSSFGNHFSSVFDADFDALCKVPGLGPEAATAIKFFLAVFQRYVESKKQMNGQIFKGEAAAEYISGLFFGCTVEYFYMISLDKDNRVLRTDLLREGSRSSVQVPTKDVITAALNSGAQKVVLAHNHPNGVLIPSDDDVSLTQVLDYALKMIEVKLWDHVIVTEEGICSILYDSHLNPFQKEGGPF